MDLYKRKLNKIKKKINSIAKIGTDNFLEYYKYIDELINKGDYSAFQELLQIEYNIDTYEYRSILEMRSDTYKMIVEQTKSDFLQKLSELYKKRGVYQQGFDIYLDNNGQIIGNIREVDIKSNDFEYYVKNKQFARLIGESIRVLDVTNSTGESYREDFQNPEWSEDQNFLERYKRALNFILN
jgi:hypothetical protein